MRAHIARICGSMCVKMEAGISRISAKHAGNPGPGVCSEQAAWLGVGVGSKGGEGERMLGGMEADG